MEQHPLHGLVPQIVATMRSYSSWSESPAPGILYFVRDMVEKIEFDKEAFPFLSDRFTEGMRAGLFPEEEMNELYVRAVLAGVHRWEVRGKGDRVTVVVDIKSSGSGMG